VLDAVILAAGEGMRLRPLTERWPKAVLPIDGRPVVATLLREIASAGIERVTIVVGRLGSEIERLVGDGAAFGLRVAYARQAEPVGSADALAAGLAAGACLPLLVSAADTVYRAGDLAAAATSFFAAAAAGGIGVRPVPRGELGMRSSVRVEGVAVREVVEKPAPGAAPSPLGGAPIWFLGEPLLPFLEGLPGPPFQLADGFQRAIDAGETVVALELGPTRDLTRPEDVVRHNFAYLWRGTR
jgi:glucose-1-phosphate thymidylyltransferase